MNKISKNLRLKILDVIFNSKDNVIYTADKRTLSKK